jgi:citrate lyase subunit beta / citryl-CoA lyase
MQTYLFVPANAERIIARAHERGAGVVILDLEDSIPDTEKDNARAGLSCAATQLLQNGCTVFVRVNADMIAMAKDFEAAITAKIHGFVIPKTRSLGQIGWISDTLRHLEAQTERQLDQLQIIALIETPEGLLRASEIATDTRVTALALGPEDFSRSCGHKPTVTNLTGPCQQIIWAARQANKQAIVFPDSIAVVKDEDRFGISARRAYDLGTDGILCIHPRQVALVQEICAPDEAEILEMCRVVEAYEAAISAGRGVALLDGNMIDLPIVERARAILG